MGQNARFAPVAASLLLIALSSCSGDDDSPEPARPAPEAARTSTQETTTQAPEVTHDEFVADLNDICRDGNRLARRYNAQAEAAANAGDYDRAASIIDRALEGQQPFYDKFDALVAPPEDAAAFKRYERQVRIVFGISKRTADALRADDLEEVQRLNTVSEQARSKRTESAIELGADECGT